MEPIAIIEDIFSAIPLPRYRRCILSMLKAANRKGYWRKEDPGSLLYFEKKLHDLVTAAHILQSKTVHSKGENGNYSENLVAFGLELPHPDLFVNKAGGQNAWDCFPRNLSRKEFADPYLVFRRFFRYRTAKLWHSDLEELVFYALSPYDSSEDLVDFKFLTINQSLQKLVEAAHLILVRDINGQDPEK